MLYRNLKGGSREVGIVLLSQAPCDKTRAKTLKLHQGRFRLVIREKFFTKRVALVGLCGKVLVAGGHRGGFCKKNLEAAPCQIRALLLTRAEPITYVVCTSVRA